MSVEEISIVEDFAATGQPSSSAAVSPVSTDPLATAAGHTHELHVGRMARHRRTRRS